MFEIPCQARNDECFKHTMTKTQHGITEMCQKSFVSVSKRYVIIFLKKAYYGKRVFI
jgi:hypothetical protein